MPNTPTFSSKSRDILQAVCADQRAKGALTVEAVEGCAKCGTEDVGRMTPDSDVCVDCRPATPRTWVERRYGS